MAERAFRSDQNVRISLSAWPGLGARSRVCVFRVTRHFVSDATAGFEPAFYACKPPTSPRLSSPLSSSPAKAQETQAPAGWHNTLYPFMCMLYSYI